MSRYAGGVLNSNVLGANMKKLSEAFPDQSDTFFDILTERIIANGFSDERLTDAVNNVIDNFKYKNLTVADVVGYDKTIKLYTHREVENLVENFQAKWSDFKIEEINGKTYRIKKDEQI